MCVCRNNFQQGSRKEIIGEEAVGDYLFLVRREVRDLECVCLCVLGVGECE